MNVIFFTSGEGFGHIARDLAVADALKRRGHNITICTYGVSAQKARAESKFTVIDMPRHINAIERQGRFDTIKTIINSVVPLLLSPFSIAKALFTIKKSGADAVVVDSYDFGLPAGILSGKPVFSTFNCLSLEGAYQGIPIISDRVIPFLGRIGTGIYEKFTTLMICDYWPPNTIAKYTVDGFAKKILYTGPQARESPDKLPSVEKIKKKLGLGKFILVTRGRYGKESEISKILEDLSKLTKKHKVVIMGEENLGLGNMQIRKFDYHTYLEYLKACDLVITHGGHSTMMECCIFGKPMVLLVAENYWERMGNARGAEELGIAELVPFSKLSATILHAAVDRMLKKKSCVLKFRELSKKENGAERAADIIESTVSIEELKRAQQ